MYVDPNASQKRSVDKNPWNVDTIQRLQLNRAMFCQFQQLMGTHQKTKNKNQLTSVKADSMYTQKIMSVKADSSSDVHTKLISSDSPLSTHANCQKMVISFLFFYFLMDILCSLEQQLHLWKHSKVSSVKTEMGPEGNDHPIHPLNNAL